MASRFACDTEHAHAAIQPVALKADIFAAGSALDADHRDRSARTQLCQ